MATKKPAKRKVGAPKGSGSKYTPELARKICERLSKGETLTQILLDDGMPAPVTVYGWQKDHPEFGEEFARARKDGFEVIFEDTLKIADDGTNDWMERNSTAESAPGYALNGEHVQRSKLRIETRLKLLARWDPKRYGERLALTGDEGGPLKIELIEMVVVKPKGE